MKMNSSRWLITGFAAIGLFTIQSPSLAAEGVSQGKARAMEAAKDNPEIVIGPAYSDALEFTARVEVPKGSIRGFTMISEESKIYPGVAKRQPGTVPYRRQVSVYIPAKHDATKAAPFILVQDGHQFTNSLPTVLDNLIHERRIPAVIAIMINSGGGDGPGSQRGLEYDTVSEKYATFVEKEVLPRVAKECNVKLTMDPEGRAAMGGGSGGACAFTAAWFRPDLYRRVLSYSGAFVNQQSPVNPKLPHGAWEYHENLIPKGDRKPIRVWLQASEKDFGWDKNEGSLRNSVIGNRRMAAALKAKGYTYRYVFAKRGGQVDIRVIRQTLPEALVWLWNGFTVQ